MGTANWLTRLSRSLCTILKCGRIYTLHAVIVVRRDTFTVTACSFVSNSSTLWGIPFSTKMEQPEVALPSTSDIQILK